MAAEPKPFSSKDTDPEALREKVVSTPKTTFDERTSGRPAWMREDGSQRNGAEDVKQEVADTPDAADDSRAAKATKATKKN